MWILILFLCLSLMWIVPNLLFARRWTNQLSAKVSFDDVHICEGDNSTLTEIITNDKVLPVPALSVRLSLDRSFTFQKEAQDNNSTSDRTVKRDVFSLMSRQKITRHLPFTVSSRGYYSIRDVDVIANDFMFKHQYYTHFPQETGLYVYPAPVDIHRIRLISQALSGSLLSKQRVVPDPFEFAGIREYQKGDPIHHINWKASARSNQLMVNEFDATTELSISIYLDLEDSHIQKKGVLTEEAIRIAGSLAAHLVSKRMPLHFYSNGCDLRPGSSAKDQAHPTGVSLYLPADGGNINELFQLLSCMDSETISGPLTSLLKPEALSSSSNETLIIISKNKEDKFQNRLAEIAGDHKSVLWVLPDRPGRGDGIHLKGVEILNWEVVR